MGAAGLIFILILGFQGSAERARADALQSELAECRSTVPFSRFKTDSTEFYKEKLADSMGLWKILKAEYDDCEREFAIHRRDCPCPPETLGAYFEVPSPDTTGGPR